MVADQRNQEECKTIYFMAQLGSQVTSLKKPETQQASSAAASKNRRRKTEYGLQLAEKQEAKKIYGVREKQFSNYYKKAIRQKGDTGTVIQQMLEMRLDNVIFRSGLATSRPQARQMVSHGFFTINGKKVNIASYQVSIKEEISVKASKLSSKLFSDIDERLEKYQSPSWIALDKKNKTARIVSKPERNELEQSFNPRMIVEFYSK
jgi:small subunit ribosomal protein S4